MCGGNDSAGGDDRSFVEKAMDFTSIGAIVNAMNAAGAATIANGGPNEAPGASRGNGYGGNEAVSGRVDGPGGQAGGGNLTPETVAAWQQSQVNGTGREGEDAYEYRRRRDIEENEARQRAEAEQRRAEAERAAQERVQAQQRQAQEDAARQQREQHDREATRPTETSRPTYSPAASPRSNLDVARAAVAPAPMDMRIDEEAIQRQRMEGQRRPDPVSATPVISPVASPPTAPSIAPSAPSAAPIAATMSSVARPIRAAPKPRPAAGLYSGLSSGSGNVRVVR